MTFGFKQRTSQWFFIFCSYVLSLFFGLTKRDPCLPARFAPFDKLLQQVQRSSLLPSSFRFVSWNIERAYQKEKIQSFLTLHKPDLCFLQEVPVFKDSDAPVLSRFLPSYVYSPSVFFASSRSSEQFIHFGLLTSSTFSFTHATSITFPQVCGWSLFHTQYRFARRNALYVQYTTKKGTLGVYNLHLEAFGWGKGKKYQIQTLLADVKKRHDTYVLITGDWNTLSGAKASFLSLLEEAGLQRAPIEQPTCSFFTLDHIFHSANMQVTLAVEQYRASDHFPLLAEVKLL